MSAAERQLTNDRIEQPESRGVNLGLSSSFASLAVPLTSSPAGHEASQMPRHAPNPPQPALRPRRPGDILDLPFGVREDYAPCTCGSTSVFSIGTSILCLHAGPPDRARACHVVDSTPGVETVGQHDRRPTWSPRRVICRDTARRGWNYRSSRPFSAVAGTDLNAMASDDYVPGYAQLVHRVTTRILALVNTLRAQSVQSAIPANQLMTTSHARRRARGKQ